MAIIALLEIFIENSPFSITLPLLTFGSVPKWPNGSGCKPDVSDFGGSNPFQPHST